MRQKFELGETYLTANAKEQLDQTTNTDDFIHRILSRHITGDWGNMPEEDKELNDAALIHGGRVMSSYKGDDGTVYWVITEHDRSATTVLLPSDY